MKYRTSPTRHLLRVSSAGRKGVCAAPTNWELWLGVLQCSQPFPQDAANLLSVLSTPRHCGRRSRPCACKMLARCKPVYDTCRAVTAGIERNKKLWTHNRDDALEPKTMVMQAIYLHQKWALGSNNSNSIPSSDLSYMSRVSARLLERKAGGPPKHRHCQIARGSE